MVCVGGLRCVGLVSCVCWGCGGFVVVRGVLLVAWCVVCVRVCVGAPLCCIGATASCCSSRGCTCAHVLDFSWPSGLYQLHRSIMWALVGGSPLHAASRRSCPQGRSFVSGMCAHESCGL